jgi:hypothetical protein
LGIGGFTGALCVGGAALGGMVDKPTGGTGAPPGPGAMAFMGGAPGMPGGGEKPGGPIPGAKGGTPDIPGGGGNGGAPGGNMPGGGKPGKPGGGTLGSIIKLAEYLHHQHHRK